MTRLNVFILGVITGIIISTVGVSGIFRIVDHGVDKVKTHSTDLAK